ncbi:MAG TPA: kynureninase [Saprospiraceae bacterium]|nr:kynureninase [Saprospiraceae bacterium]
MTYKRKFAEGQEYAFQMDLEDPLRAFKDRFHCPKHVDNKDIIYFCGNSLGLQPSHVMEPILEVMESWKTRAVEGHFTGQRPWMYYCDQINPVMARLVGAKTAEVHVMNTLTVNLHLMLVSFYRPSKSRFKILIDYSPFPSDRYALVSQIQFHGFDPKEALIELQPDDNTSIIRLEQIQNVLDKNGDEIALVMMGGVNYYSGQLYPLGEITRFAHEKGCVVGFDLAHAAGNVTLTLHEDGPDFAIWCTYKYLNAGPGNLSGCFVHERHHQDVSIPRFAGWWGYEKKTRFLMKDDFVPEQNTEGWTLSNPPILSLACILASMEIFADAGMDNLRKKSVALTGYLEYLIREIDHPSISIITPSSPDQRGCQLSLRIAQGGKELFKRIRNQGVIGDWREPDVIRVAPVPLYNSFQEVYHFTEILKNCLD